MDNQEQKPNLLDNFRNLSDFAHLVGANTLKAAEASMEAELEAYRLREKGSAVLSYV